MAKITYKIGEGVYSQVMKRIASILLVEFAKQITLGNTFLPTSVSYDNANAVSEGDIPYVSVNWLKFDNVDDFRVQQTNRNNFFIDVKAVSYDTVRKIIAVIRTILKSNQYITLDYAFGTVSETNITSAGINFEDINRDSQNVISGGLTYQCLIVEPNDGYESTALNESNYDLLIEETEKVLTIKQEY